MTEHRVGTRVDDASASPRALSPVPTAVVLLGTALAAWAVTVERMEGMDAGPGTHLGGLGWYLGIWVTMTAAMMLPSATPAALLFARAARGFPTVIFVGGYLAAWTAYGLAAYGLYRFVAWIDPGWLEWDRGGPYAAGGVIVAAGIYELTPLKERFLRRCRGPVDRREGALRAGLRHGLDCVGCCWGLMAVLFALGVMSLFWMALVAVAIFVEKVLRNGLGLSRVIALALVALGIWVAVSPSTVPRLTEPDHTPPMHMDM